MSLHNGGDRVKPLTPYADLKEPQKKPGQEKRIDEDAWLEEGGL